FLPVGVGLASGMAVVGNIGSPERLEYSAVGDTVNLAARLQEMAGPGEILAAASCFPEGPPAGWVSLGPIPVRGRNEGVVVYRHS
ncbi:MAG: adenylate/guanylate cyclase domain-containing protein, partial [Firmicutes bacterium]|nr:adenylate/guanylate cyclase domain-containing protein [Bacillota bacterium]